MLFGYSPFELVVLFISVLVAMTVHEAMHAYVGYRLGDMTAASAGRISLNPFAHIDPMMTLVLPLLSLALFGAPIMAAKPVPFNPERVRYGEYGAAMIALAGPLANLIMAIVAAVLLRGLPLGHLLASALSLFVEINVSLMVFNLVPIPPLDGSRILYAFAPESIQKVMRRLEPYGLVLAFILVFASGFGGVLLRINASILHILGQG